MNISNKLIEFSMYLSINYLQDSSQCPAAEDDGDIRNSCIHMSTNSETVTILRTIGNMGRSAERFFPHICQHKRQTPSTSAC